MPTLPESAFYILHRRPYRETSVIIDAFTYQWGRLSILAKGAKRRSSHWSMCLQPFILLQGQWQGRSELQTLTDVTIVQQHHLQGRTMLMGFYVNELMLRLLQKHAPCPDIFQIYHRLWSHPIDEVGLRYFEKDLLDTLGYGFSCCYEAYTGDPINAEQCYYFHSHKGFVYPVYHKTEGVYIDGSAIQALHQRCLTQKTHKRQCKHVLRQALAPLLGSRPLQSRSLFY